MRYLSATYFHLKASRLFPLWNIRLPADSHVAELHLEYCYFYIKSKSMLCLDYLCKPLMINNLPFLCMIYSNTCQIKELLFSYII